MTIDISLDQALVRASVTLRKKMKHSVELLRKAEKIALNYDRENGYYLAFSGGKDSQALYHIAQLAGVRFQGHMNLTSVDPPRSYTFCKRKLSRSRTDKAEQIHISECHRREDSAHYACALVLR